MPDYTLSARVTGDASNYQRAIQDANKATEEFEKSTSSFGSKIASGLATGLSVSAKAIAGLSTALGGAALAGVKYNAEIENYQTSFEVMTGSADKAADVIERLKKVGAETPFELPDLADTTQLLMNYGFTADEAIDSMMMLGDISQGSADKMERVATAYGQMSSAGKVSLEDIKQMIEAGFNPLQEISESTGESMSSLYERISEGTLSVDEITASMERATSEGGKYFQSMEKQSKTISGLFSTLSDNAQQLLGEIVGPLTDSIGSTLLPAAIDAVDQLATAFKEGGTSGLIDAGGQILADVVTGIAQALPTLISLASQILQSLISSLSANLPQLIPAGGQILLSLVSGISQLLYMLGELAFNIITTLVNSLITNGPSLVTQGSQLFSDFLAAISIRLPELLQSGADMITNLLTGLLESAPQVIQQAGTMLTDYLNTVLGALPQILDSGTQIITNLLQGIKDNAPDIIQQAGTMLSDYVATILDHLPDVLQSGADMIQSLLGGLIDMAPTIISQAGSMLVDFIAEIAAHLPDVLQKGIEIVGELVSGLIQSIPSLLEGVAQIVTSIGEKIMETDWLQLGADIIGGIAQGIVNAAGQILDAIGDALGGAVDWAKDLLGINSPSKVFRDEVGRYMSEGIGVGFERYTPYDDIRHTLDGVVSRLSGRYSAQIGPVNLNGMAMATSQVNRTETINNMSSANITQNVNIYQPVQSPVEVARAVKRAGRQLAYT